MTIMITAAVVLLSFIDKMIVSKTLFIAFINKCNSL